VVDVTGLVVDVTGLVVDVTGLAPTAGRVAPIVGEAGRGSALTLGASATVPSTRLRANATPQIVGTRRMGRATRPRRWFIRIFPSGWESGGSCPNAPCDHTEPKP
jgi:hypothetical protein